MQRSISLWNYTFEPCTLVCLFLFVFHRSSPAAFLLVPLYLDSIFYRLKMAYGENLQLIANGKNVDYSKDTENQYHFSYFCFAV